MEANNCIMIRIHAKATEDGLSNEEIEHAWQHPVRCRQRNGADDPDIWITVGVLPDGSLAGLAGFMDEQGVWCVFYAKKDPAEMFIQELDF